MESGDVYMFTMMQEVNRYPKAKYFNIDSKAFIVFLFQQHNFRHLQMLINVHVPFTRYQINLHAYNIIQYCTKVIGEYNIYTFQNVLSME